MQLQILDHYRCFQQAPSVTPTTFLRSQPTVTQQIQPHGIKHISLPPPPLFFPH